MTSLLPPAGAPALPPAGAPHAGILPLTREQSFINHEFRGKMLELFCNFEFTTEAAWSLDRFAPGRRTPERSRLDAVSREIHSVSRGVLEVAQAHGSSDPPRLDDECLAALVRVVQDRSMELLRVEDYFGLERGVELPEAFRMLESRLTAAPSLEPRLGECVVSAADERIARIRTVLRKACSAVCDGLPADHASATDLSARLQRLEEGIAELRRTWNDPRLMCVRDAAATLLQLHVAVSRVPSAECLQDRFDLNEAAPRVHAIVRCLNVDNVPGDAGRWYSPRVIGWIGEAIDRLEDFLRPNDDPDVMIEREARQRRLVVVDAPTRRVFVDGREIRQGDWDRNERNWNFLETLARNPGRNVDQSMLGSPEKHAIRSRMRRLMTFCANSAPELLGWIGTAGKGAYRLSLQPEQVVVLRDDGLGRLIEEGKRRRGRPR